MANPDFLNDIFISYAHLDNETPDKSHEGWISWFHRCLEFRVAQLYGARPKIWRDPKLQGNDVFDKEIVGQFDKVAFFVAVLSPRYLKSKWCIREVDTFSKAAEATGGLQVDNKSRIFKVVKTPTSYKEHPTILQRLLGYDFFKYDPETGDPMEFDKIQNPNLEPDFWRRLNDLALDITRLMKDFENGLHANDNAVSVPKKYVYLADTSFDLKEEHTVIKKELESINCLVYPNQQLPLVAPEYQNNVKEILKKCEYSIHMVGKHRGIIPDGTNQSVTEIQNEIAAEASETSDLKRIIWLPPNLKPANEEQEQFIRLIQTDKKVLAGADLLERPLEDLRIEILNKLAPKKEEPKPEQKPKDGENAIKQIYLICDKRDLEAIQPIDDELYNRGYEVILPIFEGDAQQVRTDHEETLRTCDAVLIYYGSPNEIWLRAKLREMTKIMGLGRKKKFLAKYIYVASPKSESKERFRSRDAGVIKNYDEFSADILQPFCNELNQGKGIGE